MSKPLALTRFRVDGTVIDTLGTKTAFQSWLTIKDPNGRRRQQFRFLDPFATASWADASPCGELAVVVNQSVDGSDSALISIQGWRDATGRFEFQVVLPVRTITPDHVRRIIEEVAAPLVAHEPRVREWARLALRYTATLPPITKVIAVDGSHLWFRRGVDIWGTPDWSQIDVTERSVTDFRLTEPVEVYWALNDLAVGTLGVPGKTYEFVFLRRDLGG